MNGFPPFAILFNIYFSIHAWKLDFIYYKYEITLSVPLTMQKVKLKCDLLI
jgi:hypothetical protein